MAVLNQSTRLSHQVFSMVETCFNTVLKPSKSIATMMAIITNPLRIRLVYLSLSAPVAGAPHVLVSSHYVCSRLSSCCVSKVARHSISTHIPTALQASETYKCFQPSSLLNGWQMIYIDRLKRDLQSCLDIAHSVPAT